MSESPNGWDGKLKPQIDKAASRNKGRKPQANKKGKFIKPAKAEGPKKLTPKFLYVSECCNALGKKAPVVKKGQEEQKKFPQTLGSFRCSNCNRPAKVRRQNNTDGIEIAL